MTNSKNVRKYLKRKFNSFTAGISASVIKPSSRFFRRVFEAGRIKQVVGLIIVAAVVFMAVLPAFLASAQTTVAKNFSQVQLDPEVTKTERSIRLPVATFEISQGFRFFHPGIDLAATKGSPVFPIMEGTVIFVDKGKFGYGNHVIVDHGSGFKSLYAHLSKIETKIGEKVDKDSIIGLVGSTGWSTGPHLHLQIWEEDRWVNPRAFLEGYFGQKLASTK